MVFASCLRPGAVAAIIVFALSSSSAWACACGCGVFDVGTASLFPSGSGATLFAEYDFMNQHQNWHGTSSAPAADNDDKKIRTDFLTLGGQYMFGHDWGIMAELPVWNRHFNTLDGDSVAGFNHVALGDVRLMGVYSGFSADMSTGVSFGVKLPTGDSGYANFDNDTEIGSGSTDLLLGGYHQGGLDADANWIWFAQGLYDQPLMHKSGYRPGAEIDAAAGAYYNSWYLGAQTKLAPMLQLIASHRWQDGGANADPVNTGYDRLMIAPGVEFDAGSWKLYGDAEVPIYQDTRGDQLVSSVLFKAIVSYAL